MLTYNLKIMIGCVSGRCLAESHIVAGLRVSSHARDPRSLDHRSTKVIVTHAEATPLFRSPRLHSRTFNIQCPCSRLETEAWKSDSWRCIFDLSNSVPGWSGPFFLCAKTARPLKDAEDFEVGKRTEDGTKLNYKRSTAFKSSSFPAFRGQMSVIGGKSKSRQCTLRATGENTAMETTYSSNTEHAEASMDGANSASLPGIICPPMTTVGKSTNIVWQECMVKREERQSLLGQKGCVIWITGLSGSGKSTLACTLDHALLNRGKLSYVLDGDNVRHGLNNNLGFSAEDRAENIRRVGEVAKLFVDAGIICIASVISPYRKDRDACRQLLKPGEFIEVFMNFPLKLCEERDPKGLYKLARAGKIKGFTGVDDPYEVPLNCEVVMQPIDGKCPTPAEMADHLLSYMEQRGLLGPLA